MARNRIRLQFGDFEEYAERIDRLSGDLKSIFNEALIESKNLVTPEIHRKMERHHVTGDTEGSIDDNSTVTWNGYIGEIKVGFNIKEGGLPSIFLMYGTPRMSKDTALYNSIYGAATKRKIQEKQKEIFEREIRRLGG